MKFISFALTFLIISLSTYVFAEKTKEAPDQSSQATKVFIEYKIGVVLPADARIEDSLAIAQKAQDAALKAVKAVGNYEVFAVSPNITLRRTTPSDKTYKRQFAPTFSSAIMETIRCRCCGWCVNKDGSSYCCEWCCEKE